MAGTGTRTPPAKPEPAPPEAPTPPSREPSGSRLAHLDAGLARAGLVIVPLAVAAGTFLLALDNGGYALTDRLSLAVGIWWAVLVAVGVRLLPRERPPLAACVAAGALALLAGVTAASIAWSASAERSYYELTRVLLYLGTFVLVVLATRRADGARWSDGLALGIAAVGVIALLSRLFPHLLGQSAAPLRYFDEKRLSYPVNYWNGLGIFVGLAFPLLLRAAVAWRTPLSRALALAPFPALIAAIYLTSSRGGVATALIGVVVFLALTAPRLPAVAATAIAALGGIGVVAVLRARNVLVDGPLGSSQAASQGRSAALLLALLCVAVAVAHFAWCTLAQPRVVTSLKRDPKRARILGAGAGLACLIALVAGLVAFDPVQKFDDFKRLPAQSRPSERDFTKAHLLSANGTGRWQLWASAKDEFAKHPFKGEGAGSFEAWWAQHGNLDLFVRDSHSVYMQTLGELGLLGFVPLAVFMAAGFVAAGRRLRRSPDRTTVAALSAALAGFALAAGIDWMWQLTVVGLVGIVCVALLTGPATAPAAPRPTASRPRWTLLPRAGVVVTCLVVICVAGLALLTQARLQESESDASKGDVQGAVSAAEDARALEPWASSPYLQLALLDEQSGDLASARAWIRDALDHDGANWRIWLVAARIDTKAGAIPSARRALARARSLNPRSPLFARR